MTDPLGKDLLGLEQPSVSYHLKQLLDAGIWQAHAVAPRQRLDLSVNILTNHAINAGKIERELGWRPAETFASGIRQTVAWYLAHQDWVSNVISGEYRHWITRNYAERLAP